MDQIFRNSHLKILSSNRTGWWVFFLWNAELVRTSHPSFCNLFNNASPVMKTTTASNKRVANEWWNGKDLEGNGRGLGTITELAWRNWGTPRSPSVRIAGLRAEIWTRDLPNRKECWPLDHDVRNIPFLGIHGNNKDVILPNRLSARYKAS
jgi:hypothetical protein